MKLSATRVGLSEVWQTDLLKKVRKSRKTEKSGFDSRFSFGDFVSGEGITALMLREGLADHFGK